MPYSLENLKSVTDGFKAKKQRAEELAERRKEELYIAIPEIKEIDGKISSTGLRIFGESVGRGRNGLEERISRLKRETDALYDERRRLMTAAGFDVDYDEPKYECAICSDSGFTNTGARCKCFSRALAVAGFESSGMAKLISKQSFENFSLDYYGDSREMMEDNLHRAKRFADEFGHGGAKNLLFIGTTGLGKTHLSSAIAKAVIEGGADVVYESAQNIFSDFEYERFSRAYSDGAVPRTKKYFDCDLLIIDDLGTEVSNQFTVSCLYNLMNTRIVEEKSMIISTNVTKEDMLSRYSDRILSRLFGEFEVFVFSGRDIRSQKLRKGV